MKSFTIGADPEMFLVDAAGAFVSVIDKIGGTKKEPRPILDKSGFAVQEDNVAAEYNIAPAHSPEELYNNLKIVQDFLSDEVAKYGLRLSNVSAAIFDDVELFDPRAREFGCDPDYNAWTGRRNPRPRASNPNLRSAGGHIHIGHTFNSKEELMSFMQHMDLFLGVPSVLMDPGEDRKQLYGKHGAFRPKPYGGEYRVLSNFWTLDKDLTYWVWNSVEMAMDAWQNKKINLQEVYKDIVECIDNNNKPLAKKMVDHHGLYCVGV